MANTYSPLNPSDKKKEPTPPPTMSAGGDVELGAGSHSLPQKGQRKRLSIEDLHLPEESEQIELDEDVYGAVVYSVTYDAFELMTGCDYDGLDSRLNAYRMFFCLLLLACNYALQLGLLAIIYMYVAAPSMHKAQLVYQRYHAEVFVAGVFQADKWEHWDGAERLCNVAFGNYWFMFAILGLWWVSMAIEVRKTELMYYRFKALTNTTDPYQIITRVDEPEKLNLIMGLTAWMRAVLYTILLFPKLLIAGGLLVVGTIWLAATDSFENLVLNSVALSFIINIDEIIFAGLVPFTMKNNINITRLVNVSMTVREGHIVEVVRGYRDSSVWLIAIVSGVALYMSPIGQTIPGIGIFPGYLADTTGCPDWWAKKAAQVCVRGEECFKLG